MPRPTSDIWQYFTIVPADTKVKKAKCTFCGHEQSSGVTRLAEHLAHKCQHIPLNIREELRAKTDEKGKARAHHEHNGFTDSGMTGDFANMLGGALVTAPASSLQHQFTPSPSSRGSTHNNAASRAGPMHTSIATTVHSADKTTLDWHLARAFYSANIPLSAIDHPLMVQFFQRLRPGYTLPTGKRLEQFLLKNEHWDLQELRESQAEKQQMPESDK